MDESERHQRQVGTGPKAVPLIKLLLCSSLALNTHASFAESNAILTNSKHYHSQLINPDNRPSTAPVNKKTKKNTKKRQAYNAATNELLIEDLVDQYARDHAIKAIIDPRVKGRVTMLGDQNHSTTDEEFYTTLYMHGYSAYVHDGTLYVRIQATIKTDSVPLLNKSNRKYLASRSTATDVIVLQHAPAVELLPILRPLIPQWGHLAAHRASNALLITATVGKIETIRKMMQLLDVTPKPAFALKPRSDDDD